jgi:hypothetical protein
MIPIFFIKVCSLSTFLQPLADDGQRALNVNSHHAVLVIQLFSQFGNGALDQIWTPLADDAKNFRRLFLYLAPTRSAC